MTTTKWIGSAVAGMIFAAIAAQASAQSCDDFDECTSDDICRNGICEGTPRSSGTCDDGDPCTINDQCGIDGMCGGDPAPAGTSCGSGCGTCQQLIPGIMVCTDDGGNDGMPCDVGFPCFTGTCFVQGGAFCLFSPIECADTDGNPCTDNCNAATGQCERDIGHCIPNCETCNTNTGACEPANLQSACDDFDPCTAQSRCEAVDLGGEMRGICRAGAPGGGDTPTPTRTAVTPTVTAGTPAATATVTPTRGPGSCVGDCSGNGMVAINELITGVNIALGSADISSCPSFDMNGNGGVEVNELVAAVNNALNGCA
ncbi:MAG: hypothetical protein AB7V27_01020 [Candidatus Binatia bacterium]